MLLSDQAECFCKMFMLTVEHSFLIQIYIIFSKWNMFKTHKISTWNVVFSKYFQIMWCMVYSSDLFSPS